jgi:hypothetical protein
MPWGAPGLLTRQRGVRKRPTSRGRRQGAALSFGFRWRSSGKFRRVLGPPNAEMNYTLRVIRDTSGSRDIYIIPGEKAAHC